MVLSGCIYYPTNSTKQTSVPRRWHSHRLTRRRRAVANEHEKKGGGKQNVFVCAGGGEGHPGDRKSSDIIRFATSRNTVPLCTGLLPRPILCASRSPELVSSLSVTLAPLSHPFSEVQVLSRQSPMKCKRSRDTMPTFWMGLQHTTGALSPADGELIRNH